MYLDKNAFQIGDLTKAAQLLDEVATTINNVLNFSRVTRCGETLDWNVVFERLRDYAWAARQLQVGMAVNLTDNPKYLIGAAASVRYVPPADEIKIIVP